MTVSGSFDADTDRLNLRSVLSFLRRRLLMIATIVAICVLLALILTQATQRLFTATATVLVQAKADQVTPSSAKTDDLAHPVAEQIATEAQLVESRAVTGQVVDSLELMKNPAFVAKAERSRTGGALARWFGMPTGPAATASQQRDDAISLLLASLEVKQVATSYALQITYSDPDPVIAARIANAFADAYTGHQIVAQSSENKKVIGLLATRMDELRLQAQADFSLVQQYRIANRLQSKSGTSLTEQEISAYNQQVATARSDATQDATRLATAQNQYGNGPGGVGEAATSPVVATLRGQRALVSARVTDMAGRYLPDYPELVTAREQLADIDAQIANEVRRSIRLLSSTARASAARLGSLQGSLGAASGKLDNNNRALVTLNDLERKADASQALYESYLTRFKESVASSGAEQPSARLMSTAPVPTRPSSPNLPLNLVLGLLIGLLLGVVAAIAAEGAYSGLTTREDVERRLSVRHLGSTPLLQSVEPRALTPLDTIGKFPGGAFAESMRSALTAIRQSIDSPIQIVAITSALPGEGKTTIAACIACAAALGKERVAIVDCDVVRSNLSEMFGTTPGQVGLHDLFAKRASLDALSGIRELGGATLFPITEPFEDGARLLDQVGFEKLLEDLKQTFDLVILDCAPILPIAETREIVTHADAVLFVTEWRQTEDRTVRTALKMLPPAATRNLGVVLNRVDMRKWVRFGDGDPEMFSARANSYYKKAVK